MSEQAFWIIIVALVGIIIGGAGGAALFRNAAKKIIPSSTDVADTAAVVAATASSTAAVVAATATSVAAALKTEIQGQIAEIRSEIHDNSKKLNDLEIVITGFMGACPERHKAINQRLESIETAQDRSIAHLGSFELRKNKDADR
jgi:hypothetical protein